MLLNSRLNQDENIKKLKLILTAASNNVNYENYTIEELINAVDERFFVLFENIDALEVDNTELRCKFLDLERDYQNVQNINFDEALDIATVDFMDSLMESGVADCAFSTGISFESDVVMTKEDLKPILRQAINTWIQNKIN